MPPGESRTRSRTRRTILDAAVTVLSEDRSAPLSRVADTAGVARSTLQRYFADRAALLAALSAYASERIDEAADRARTGEGTALEGLRRLVHELFDLGDVVMLLGPEWEEEQGDEPDSPADRVLRELLARGRAEGTLDARLGDAWIEQLLWAVLYTAWTHVRDRGAPKHEALTSCLLSLTKAVGAE